MTEATATTPISREVQVVGDPSKDQLPSQASERDLGSMPISKPLSTLSEGTFQNPSRDISSYRIERHLASVSSISRSEPLVEDYELNQLPSPVYGGNLGLPTSWISSSIGLCSPSPEGTSLAPHRELPPSKCGRQLALGKDISLQVLNILEALDM